MVFRKEDHPEGYVGRQEALFKEQIRLFKEGTIDFFAAQRRLDQILYAFDDRPWLYLIGLTNDFKMELLADGGLKPELSPAERHAELVAVFEDIERKFCEVNEPFK